MALAHRDDRAAKLIVYLYLLLPRQLTRPSLIVVIHHCSYLYPCFPSTSSMLLLHLYKRCLFSQDTLTEVTARALISQANSTFSTFANHCDIIPFHMLDSTQHHD